MLSHLSDQAPTESPELTGSLRRGRRTSSPLQFGQTTFMLSAQLAQYVHSLLQMYAISLGVSGAPHFSHVVFNSNPIKRELTGNN